MRELEIVKGKQKPLTPEEYLRVSIEEDNDGHTYVIPYDRRGEFRKLLEQGEEDYYESFNGEFGDYIIDGGLSEVELFIKV